MSTYKRLNVEEDFEYTEENPLLISGWTIFKDRNGSINVRKEDKGYIMNFTGSLFVTDDHCFYRYKEFQLLLDRFDIDKIKKMTASKNKITLFSGVKDINKGFTVYSDGKAVISKTKKYNEGEDIETMLNVIEFTDQTWALAEMHNTKYTYRILYVWDNSHKIMNKLSEIGIGSPLISTEII